MFIWLKWHQYSLSYHFTTKVHIIVHSIGHTVGGAQGGKKSNIHIIFPLAGKAPPPLAQPGEINSFFFWSEKKTCIGRSFVRKTKAKTNNYHLLGSQKQKKGRTGLTQGKNVSGTHGGKVHHEAREEACQRSKTVGRSPLHAPSTKGPLPTGSLGPFPSHGLVHTPRDQKKTGDSHESDRRQG